MLGGATWTNDRKDLPGCCTWRNSPEGFPQTVIWRNNQDEQREGSGRNSPERSSLGTLGRPGGTQPSFFIVKHSSPGLYPYENRPRKPTQQHYPGGTSIASLPGTASSLPIPNSLLPAAFCRFQLLSDRQSRSKRDVGMIPQNAALSLLVQ